MQPLPKLDERCQRCRRRVWVGVDEDGGPRGAEASPALVCPADAVLDEDRPELLVEGGVGGEGDDDGLEGDAWGREEGGFKHDAKGAAAAW